MIANLFKQYLVRAAINNANGTWMTVTFVKKDGTVRTLNCRTGVKKYILGTGTPRFEVGNVTVWSPRDGYRTIRLSSVKRITAAGNTVVFGG